MMYILICAMLCVIILCFWFVYNKQKLSESAMEFKRNKEEQLRAHQLKVLKKEPVAYIEIDLFNEVVYKTVQPWSHKYPPFEIMTANQAAQNEIENMRLDRGIIADDGTLYMPRTIKSLKVVDQKKDVN